MRAFRVGQVFSLKGKISLSGDKSIAHRAIILSAITKEKTTIRNFPFNQDCLSTVRAFQKLGLRITQKTKGEVCVYGKGLYGLDKPQGPIFVGDSGTTLRIILGVLAGQAFTVKLSAGKSLSRRPMRRVTEPLRKMGIVICGRRSTLDGRQDEYPPITIKGGNLKAITYKMPVASAQVKSAILLAGLYAQGTTKLIEPIKTRDHTERMLKFFKAEIKLKQNKIVITGGRELFSPGRIYIPGDISSASFFIVLACIIPNSSIVIRNITLNPLRTGIIKVLKRMGANIEIQKVKGKGKNFEPMGDLIVKSSSLRGTIVKKEEIPSLIDELPILMVAACYAKGKTVFKNAQELRVKETDRIKSMLYNLSKMGADVRVLKKAKSEEVIIRGVKELTAGRLKGFTDHRTAMSMVVAGLSAKGSSVIDDISCIRKSFPHFLTILKQLLR